MFRFNREQKVFTIDKIQVGGQAGENPPLLMRVDVPQQGPES